MEPMSSSRLWVVPILKVKVNVDVAEVVAVGQRIGVADPRGRASVVSHRVLLPAGEPRARKHQHADLGKALQFMRGTSYYHDVHDRARVPTC